MTRPYTQPAPAPTAFEVDEDMIADLERQLEELANDDSLVYPEWRPGDFDEEYDPNDP